MTITLNAAEFEVLMRQDPTTKEDGGYQRLLITLQEKLYAGSQLDLTNEDLERIPKYAFDYGNGGWENRLKSIFQRHLGANLGR